MPAPSLTLAQLLTALDAASLSACSPAPGQLPPSLRVGKVTDQDQDVAPGDVFVALRGSRVDGHDRVPLLPQAAAVIVERPVVAPPGVVVVQVPSTRRALGPLAAAALGQPARALPVIGITGTNGKTSTTFLLASMARAAGRMPGIIGTTGHWIGDQKLPSTHTTPSAPVLQRLLAQMRDAGVGLAAMEVSSIALDAGRADGTPFAAAIFTNLTRDHLDYHGTMEAYAQAKRRLFAELLEGRAILNAADPASAQMIPPLASGRPVWWFNGADLSAEIEWMRPEGTRARFHTPMGGFTARVQLPGRHNIDNALGAVGAALSVGLPLDAVCAGLEALPSIPGRLERVPNDRGFEVFVDYAHSDDALRRVLGELRKLNPRRILTVFGCGGDRDRGKRPLMGAAAAEGSDWVVVTSDNPRSEDPSAILADILPGLGERPYAAVLDRREAIATAIAAAQPGDVVLIAGKGHEAVQIFADRTTPFDDRQVAAEVLR